MQKAPLNGKPFFDPRGGETVNPRKGGANAEIWSLSLQLQHSEGAP
jgi:hypothetical protein